jgi:hypothetical protein
MFSTAFFLRGGLSGAKTHPLARIFVTARYCPLTLWLEDVRSKRSE